MSDQRYFFILRLLGGAVVVLALTLVFLLWQSWQNLQTISLEMETVQAVENQQAEVTVGVPVFSPTPVLPTIDSLEQVWARPNQSFLANCQAEPSLPKCQDNWSLMVTGDVLLARSVNARMVQKNDPSWPFQFVADRLRSADLTYINLETPLVENCPIKTDGMVFCGQPNNVEGLKFAGIDLVNLANNHIGNQGIDGVLSTVAILQKNSLDVTGYQDPLIKEMKGQKVAFLGFNEVDQQPLVNHATEENIRSKVESARQQADVVIVQFHWGAEYTYQPTSRQQLFAQVAVEAGADLVIGAHPHWYQQISFINNKAVMYSHGNFVFDQMWSQETREGIAAQYTFQGKNLVDVEFLPLIIEEYGQPRWLEGPEKERVLTKLREISRE